MQLTLRVPDATELLVHKGDLVTLGDPLFKAENIDHVEVAISQSLGIKPHDIFSVSTKTIGDIVTEGEIIAHKKKLLSTRTIPSPVTGSVISISHDHGSITIATKGQQTSTLPSFFSATIADIRTNLQEFVIELSGIDFEVTSSLSDRGGPVFYALDRDSYLTHIGDEIHNKILVIKELKSHIETKSDALGAIGIIYLEGQAQTDLPSWKIKDEEEFIKITSDKKGFVVISSKDNKGVIYE